MKLQARGARSLFMVSPAGGARVLMVNFTLKPRKLGVYSCRYMDMFVFIQFHADFFLFFFFTSPNVAQLQLKRLEELSSLAPVRTSSFLFFREEEQMRKWLRWSMVF